MKWQVKSLAVCFSLFFSSWSTAAYDVVQVIQQTPNPVPLGSGVTYVVTVQADAFGASAVQLFAEETIGVGLEISETLCNEGCGLLLPNTSREIVVGPLFENKDFSDRSSQFIQLTTYWSGQKQESIQVTTRFVAQLDADDFSSASAFVETVQTICENATSERLRHRCDQLYSLSKSDIEHALKQFLPDEVVGERQAVMKLGRIHLRGIKNRLASLRLARIGRATRRFQTSDLSLYYDGKEIPLGLIAQQWLYRTGGSAGDEINNANDRQTKAARTETEQTEQSQIRVPQSSAFDMGRWGGFFSGQLLLGDKDDTDLEAGYDYDTKSFLAGVDYRVNDQWIAGGAVGIANAETEFANNEGGLDSGVRMLSAYTNYYFSEKAYIDAVVTYGSSDYETARKILYSGVDTQTKGKTDGQQLGCSVGGGAELNYRGIMLNPYGRVDYSDGVIEAYDESGDGLALSFDKQSFTSMTTVVGIRATRVFSTRKAVIVPSIDVEWEHEFEDDEQSINVRFVEDSNNQQFSVGVEEIDTDYFNLGLAVSATFTGGQALFARYQSVLGKDHFSENVVELGGHIEF